MAESEAPTSGEFMPANIGDLWVRALHKPHDSNLNTESLRFLRGVNRDPEGKVAGYDYQDLLERKFYNGLAQVKPYFGSGIDTSTEAPITKNGSGNTITHKVASVNLLNEFTYGLRLNPNLNEEAKTNWLSNVMAINGLNDSEKQRIKEAYDASSPGSAQ